jgi:hypothetical protein
MCIVIGIQAIALTIVYSILLWGFSANTFCRKQSAPSKKAIKYTSSLSFSKSINGVSVQLRKPRRPPMLKLYTNPMIKAPQTAPLSEMVGMLIFAFDR